MYLKNLFHQSKPWCMVVILFIVAQLFINYKRGMVVSPFFHYGMYAEKMAVQESYPVYQISINNTPLQTKDFSAQQWDKIMLPLVYYQKHREWNQAMYKELHRITGIGDSSKYVNNITSRGFYKWYQQYLTRILHTSITSVLVEQKNYFPAR